MLMSATRSTRRLGLAFAFAVVAALPLAASAQSQPLELGDFSEWDLTNANSAGAAWLSVDADGTVWFSEQVANRLAHLAPATNALTEWALPGNTIDAWSYGVSADHNGRLYYAQSGESGAPTALSPNLLGLLDPAAGTITQWDVTTLPVTSGAFLVDFTGAAWFTIYQVGQVARVDTTNNTLTQWSIGSSSALPDGIVEQGGFVYFGEDGLRSIARLDPATNIVTSWQIPGGIQGYTPELYISVDSGGGVWFATNDVDYAGHLDPSTNTFELWQEPSNDCARGACFPYGIQEDASGTVWLSDYVGRIWSFSSASTPDLTTVVTPSVLTAAVTNTAIVPRVEEITGVTSVIAPVTTTVPPTNAGEFIGWLTPSPGSNPGALALDSQGHAWYGNYGPTPIGVGRLVVREDQPPVAVISANSNVATGATVTVDGSQSSDPENEALTYQFTLTGPSGSSATLSSATAEQPTFVADLAGTYTVELVVTDIWGLHSAQVSKAIVASPPCDAVAYAPAQSQYGIVEFEDLFPNSGDMDFNDENIAYNYAFAFDANKQLIGLQASYDVVAIGAGIVNGFYVQFPIDASLISSALVSVGGADATAIAPLTTLPGQSGSCSQALATFQIAANTRDLYMDETGFINSEINLPLLSGNTVVLSLAFTTPLAARAFDTSAAPFDIFTARSADPIHQIHLPVYEGSATCADGSLFGQGQDGSNRNLSAHGGADNSGRWYVDTNGLPWALNIPQTADWSIEKKAIDLLYPQIDTFALTAGAQDSSFYLPANEDETYSWQANLTTGTASAPPAPPQLGTGLFSNLSCTETSDERTSQPPGLLRYTLSIVYEGPNIFGQGLGPTIGHSAVLATPGEPNLTVPPAGCGLTKTFANSLLAGTHYDVTIVTQPTTGHCWIANAVGNLLSNVTLTMSCTPYP